MKFGLHNNCFTVLHSYTRKKIYYNKADYEVISLALHEFDWEIELQDLSVDKQWSFFKEYIKKIRGAGTP